MDDTRRRTLIAAAGFVVAPLARAQPARRATIGFLSVNSQAAMSARTEAFQQGLRELGYVEGKDIIVEYRYADAKPDRMSGLAAELVRLKVQVIVSEGTTATRYAKEATSAIPIVMAQDPDPVGTGFAVSLARPGGNITGLSNIRTELGAKRLQFLKEAVPGLARVAVLGNSATPGVKREMEEIERAAAALKVHVQFHDVRSPKDIDSAFQAASKERADAVLTLGGPVLLSNRARVVDLAARSRLPAIYHTTDFVDDGGLMSYSVTISDLFRRAAIFVDKILKGARPAELPIEQPTKVALVINVKAARQMGLTIPRSMLLSADRVIE